MSDGAAKLPVVVVGGGMAGLTAACKLHAAGVPVTLLERAERAGGVVGTVDVGGHVFERGPTTVMASGAHITSLIDEVGLTDALLHSHDAAHRRFVWRHGRLHLLPDGPGAFFRSGLLSLKGKLRLLAEPFVGRNTPDTDETLGDFLGRRLGREAVDALVDPFVTGVYAGSPTQLGADAFPTLVQADRLRGSIVRGMIAIRKQRKAEAAANGEAPKKKKGRPGKTPLLTFPEGLRKLPDTIRRSLGTRVRLGHDVFGVDRDPRTGQWQVHAVADERQVHYDASAVLLATPANVTATLLERLAPNGAQALGAIPHPHVAAVGLGYKRSAVAHPLDGFGLLCASDSPLPDDAGPILGVLFVSSIFDGRAPEGHVSLNVMLGGSRDPEAAELSDGAIVERARRAAEVLLSAHGEPTAVSVTRWRHAIPQYPPGHTAMVAALREEIAAHPGLYLAGNYLSGVGLDPTIGSGAAAASVAIAAASSPGAEASAV